MCSSRGVCASASIAEISTAGTTRTPWRSPARSASATPATVSWSLSASSSTPARAARSTTSAASSAPSEFVECDCRSKRIGVAIGRRAYATGGDRRTQGAAWVAVPQERVWSVARSGSGRFGGSSVAGGPGRTVCSGPGVLVRGAVAGDRDQYRHLTSEHLAQGLDRGVEAPRLAGQRPAAVVGAASSGCSQTSSWA